LTDLPQNNLYFAKLAYKLNTENSTMPISLGIWCLQHPALFCLILPANIGLDFELIKQNLAINNESKTMSIASMVACDLQTDRFIPRSNSMRFEFSQQCLTPGNNITVSGARTFAQKRSLLQYDNHDFLQSLGITELQHDTVCCAGYALPFYIFINTFNLHNTPHAIHSIYI
jgi:hypothetical protein